MRRHVVRLDFQRLPIGVRRALGLALSIQNIALELPGIVEFRRFFKRRIQQGQSSRKVTIPRLDSRLAQHSGSVPRNSSDGRIKRGLRGVALSRHQVGHTN